MWDGLGRLGLKMQGKRWMGGEGVERELQSLLLQLVKEMLQGVLESCVPKVLEERPWWDGVGEVREPAHNPHRHIAVSRVILRLPGSRSPDNAKNIWSLHCKYITNAYNSRGFEKKQIAEAVDRNKKRKRKSRV